MMRVVFLLFAEERGLPPVDNELYARAYSAGRLGAELAQRDGGQRGQPGAQLPGMASAAGEPPGDRRGHRPRLRLDDLLDHGFHAVARETRYTIGCWSSTTSDMPKK
jgi:hypothetical protein